MVYNYSRAGIPLETMWTDIDYMSGRRVFTLDDERFPVDKMRELVSYLHKHDQHYIVMVDPAVSNSGKYYPGFVTFELRLTVVFNDQTMVPITEALIRACSCTVTMNKMTSTRVSLPETA